MQDLKTILTKFQEIVSPNFCSQLARECGFIQRSTSQLKGHEFAQAMMIPNANLESETLNSLAVRMQTINKDCNLSASALAQRINTNGAVTFMKDCFKKIFKEIVKREFVNISDLRNLSGFNRILIQDSTRIELHEKLSPYFKGSGGVASTSSIKIDYIFDYLSEEIVDIEFFSGNKPDQSLANRINPFLEKDDLVVRDLGYFVLERLKEIEEAGAYYISRWKVNEDVYLSKEATEPLNLAEFLDKTGLANIEVFIGKEKHPVRLVACLLSKEAINKRIREANKNAKRHRTTISKKKLSLLKYSIFITNIPAEILSSELVMATYRARWRAEMIFKRWKSCLKIHMFKGYKIERLYCFLYGRLIMILVLESLIPPLILYARRIGGELSCYKFINYMIADHGLFRVIQDGKTEEYIDKLLKDIPRRLCMDKRKRRSLRSNVRLGQFYYNELDIKGLHKNVA